MALNPLNWLYLRPDENVLAGRTATSIAGTPDTDAITAYINDTRTAFAAKWAAGGWGVSISVATMSVQVVAIINHSIDSATVAVGGDVSTTIAIPTAPPNKVLLNPYKLLSSPTAGVNTLTFSGTNTLPAIIGEVAAGVPREMRPLMMTDNQQQQFDGRTPIQGDYMNVPQFDERRKWRRYSGTQYYSQSELDDLIAWQDASNGASLPSLLIPDQAVNDCRAVIINELQYSRGPNKDKYRVTIEFMEFPRYRWL